MLQIDDAFVGGVCRCQHCGAIQTVPSHLKKGSTEKKVKTQKTLFKKSVRDEAVPSSGLDELAQVVSSSGLSPGRLQELGREKRPKGRKNRGMLVGGAVAGGLLVVLVGAWALMSGGNSSGASSGSASAAPVSSSAVPVAAPATRPSFLGVSFDDQRVAYVIDRGNSTGEFLEPLKLAAFKSLSTLGTSRTFQIVFWENDQKVESFPLGSPAEANPLNIAAAEQKLQDVNAYGQSSVGPALVKAMAGSPDVILLATAKGNALDEKFVQDVISAIQGKGKSVKLYAFDVGTEPTDMMKELARRTGGKATYVSAADLKQFSKRD